MIPTTITRFRVGGDAPASVDDAALSILADYAFKEQTIGVPQAIECGFVTGEHVFDTQFTYAKNDFGTAMLFGLRVDTHKVPTDVKQAIKRQHEQAVAAGKDDSLGFMSKAEKAEARELANRQIQEELAAGKHRKSKMVAILWDLKNRDLYFGSTSDDPICQLHKIMTESFGVYLDRVTSGSLACELMNNQREFEDIKPMAFTDPPAGVVENHEDASSGQDISIPLVPWAHSSINKKDYLGNEFLLWLWFILEKREGSVSIPVEGVDRKDSIGILFDKTLNMDCAWGVGGKQSLTGDGPTRLREAREALLTGKWPRKAVLMIADESSNEQWELSFAADPFVLGSLKLPSADEAQSPREVIECKITSLLRLQQIMQSMFSVYLKERYTRFVMLRREMEDWIKHRK